jgi:proton-dependent oligopeptide transporter, POT family
LSLSDRAREIRIGFHPTFWVANGMELFERLAYYGQATVLSIFLRNHLHFSEIETGQLSSLFGALIYALPIVAGTLADKFGFRRSFSIAFSILAVGYFLIGSTGMEAFSGFYGHRSLFWILSLFLVFTALGGSFIKPSVLGTVAVTSKPETKSLGYALYYWLVNIGAAAGPTIAFFVRARWGIEFVYLVSALACALMVFVNLVFYREVRESPQQAEETLRAKLKNLIVVLGNLKFMAFLLIFSLYWLMFWQIFIIVPFYLIDFISSKAPFEIIQSVDAWGIIALQLVVNRLTRHLSPRTAIVTGFAVSTCSWLLIALHPSVATLVAGILVFSIGEMTQAPRYYEYISDLAPRGQQGLFQGYAFLPIAIAWAVGGTFGGWLYQTYAKETETGTVVWLVLFGVGVLATVSMAAYNRISAARK